QAPAVGDFLMRMWRDAGLPAGVLELVQGGADTGRHLAVDCPVDGVLFTGSWAVGRALAEATLDQPEKLLALEMGGRNAMLVLEDAHLPTAVAEAALSLCATTGQRCTSMTRLFVARSRLDEMQERLCAVLDGIAIGPPLSEDVFMGPLVSRAAWDRVQAFRGLAAAAGGERVYRREMDRLPPYCGPSLVRFDKAEQSHRYQREEVFGPECALYPIDDLDQGIACVNDSDYGLAASVMTPDRTRYEHCVGRVRTGILNWNKGTIGASGKLPFGGGRRSGNDRPAGISAAIYCTSPQAHLESDAELDPETLPPGMPAP
nr:aldehyde dehydrogenase family protein [Myxococcota bacterium]